MNEQNLQRAWDVTQRSTAADWEEWARRFSVELLHESPSAALRACHAVAQVQPSLARELFHAAFVACWFALENNGAPKENLVRSLETAFRSPTIPHDILQVRHDNCRIFFFFLRPNLCFSSCRCC